MMGTRTDRSRKPYSRPEPRRRSDGEWAHDKAPAVPTRNAQTATPNTKLIVSNLHYEVTPKDLTAIFGQIGTLIREPTIRYDRSGRSSGVAFVTYESPAEARRAVLEYNGKLCKGQPMTVEYHSAPPPRPQVRKTTSAPSLINRIQKPPLLDRLSQKGTVSTTATGPGPVRSKNRAVRVAREPKKPKTAQQLDMELDAFMKDDVQPTPAQTQQDGDVEMA